MCNFMLPYRGQFPKQNHGQFPLVFDRQHFNLNYFLVQGLTGTGPLSTSCLRWLRKRSLNASAEVLKAQRQPLTLWPAGNLGMMCQLRWRAPSTKSVKLNTTSKPTGAPLTWPKLRHSKWAPPSNISRKSSTTHSHRQVFPPTKRTLRKHLTTLVTGSTKQVPDLPKGRCWSGNSETTSLNSPVNFFNGSLRWSCRRGRPPTACGADLLTVNICKALESGSSRDVIKITVSWWLIIIGIINGQLIWWIN